MKHLRKFNEDINFNSLLVDVFNHGTNDIKQNAVYLEKLESSWGEDVGYFPDTMRYNIYLGPCDIDNGLSDSIGFSDEFIESLLQASGINQYHLHSSENSHTLYFRNDQEANERYNELLEVVSSYGFNLIGDN